MSNVCDAGLIHRQYQLQNGIYYSQIEVKLIVCFDQLIWSHMKNLWSEYMPLLTWNETFQLGIDEFDNHHKHLVDLLNKTYDGFTQEASHEELATVLDELIDYATYHFAAEEYWMGVNKYPNLSQHSKEHERFCQRVIQFLRHFHNGKALLSLRVLQFLNSWLKTHILETDAEYGRFAANL
jgi:hemerythrin